MKKIVSFKGTFLSNMFEIENGFEFNGLRFRNSEAAFQAEKCANPEDKVRFCNLNGYQAKKLGKSIELRKDWEEIKLSVMKNVLIAKFSNKELFQKLLETKDYYLEEGNNWNDTFWGVCNNKGENHLGLILMEIRDGAPTSSPKAPSNKKITNWALIEHVGTIASQTLVSAIYSKAYSLNQCEKIFTYKQLVQLMNPNCTSASEKQKAWLRGTKHPRQVIIVTSIHNLFNIDYIVAHWIEKDTPEITILAVSDDCVVKEYNWTELYPELAQTMGGATNSKARRCANIWAKALGWQFTAPLYRDNDYSNTIDFGTKAWKNIIHAQQSVTGSTMVCYNKEHKIDFTAYEGYRVVTLKDKNGNTQIDKYGNVVYGAYRESEGKPSNSITKNLKTMDTDSLTKYTSKPETYRKAHCVASDAECNEFFAFYKELYKNNLLEEALEPDWYICPDCGRPVYVSPYAENKCCEYCNHEFELDIEFTAYYENNFDEAI